MSDGTSVFFFGSGWHDDGGFVQEARLIQIPVGGGPMTTRFSYSGGANAQGGTGESPGGLVLDGSNLFFCASGHAWRMPIAGGNAVDLSPLSAPPNGVFGCTIPVVDAVNLYSGADSNDPSVWFVPKDGGTADYLAGIDTINLGAWGGEPMVTDGTYVYWVPYGGAFSNTMQRALGTGEAAPETFVPAALPDAGAETYLGTITSHMVFTGGNIFWVEFATGFAPYYMWKVSTTGGDGAVPTIVTSGNTIGAGMVTDGAFIYWLETNATYQIKKTSVAGGGPITTVVPDAIYLTENDSGAPRYTVDATNVYWLGPPNLYQAAK